MPGNSRFPNRWLAPLCLVTCCLTLPAQIHTVDPKKTITFDVAGATAAYSLDASLAEATAEDGRVSVTGKQPGATHVVVITPGGVQTFEVLVTTPPPHYPPGFVMPVNGAEAAQSGYYEGRYYSSPAQMQSQLDFLKIREDDRTHVHVVETNLLRSIEPGQPRIALSSASYQIVTPGRDITLFDKYLDESQLTINGSIVRGFHMQQDNWFVHAGYTSVATFEGLFLPVQPELVAGGGYGYSLSGNSSITASFYRVQIPASDRLGRSGSIGDLRYKYSPHKSFWLTTDLGISRGVGGAGKLYYKTDRDDIVALVRYMPVQFASLGANNFRGLHTDLAWTRHVTSKFDAAGFSGNDRLGGGQPPLSAHRALGCYRRGARLQVPDHCAIRPPYSKFRPTRGTGFSVEAFRGHRTIPVRGDTRAGERSQAVSGNPTLRLGRCHIHRLRGTRYQRPDFEFHLRAGGGIATDSGSARDQGHHRAAG